MSFLKVQDLSLGYDGHIILENLNFEISQGDYLCIVGENGSGKTTLIKTLLGLHAQTTGKIIWDKGRKSIGYLPQQTELQRDFPASVMEIVLSGCQEKCGLRPYYNRCEKDKARCALEKMEMTSYEKKCYRELSGGQQQRVLLARALCAAEDLLLLDEPIAGLDPKASSQMYELINMLHKKEGLTVIMISHDIAAALGYATHILHIGKRIFFGNKKEYAESDIGCGYVKLSEDV